MYRVEISFSAKHPDSELAGWLKVVKVQLEIRKK